MRLGKLVIGNRNPAKVREIEEGLASVGGLELIRLSTAIGRSKAAPENEFTFLGNARQKALWYSERVDLPVLSEASGLKIPRLSRRVNPRRVVTLPGVFSDRFCELDLSVNQEGELAVTGTEVPRRRATWKVRDCDNRVRLIGMLRNWKASAFRSPSYTCALAVAYRGEVIWDCVRCLLGGVTDEERGCNGFGFDSLFVPEGEGRTLAQLSPEERQEMPYRGKALRCLRAWIREEPEPEAVRPGCWVRVFGFLDLEEAVCTEVKGGTVFFRYEAERCSDGKTIWVANGEPREYVAYLREGDKMSERVLKLTGPYGEG